MIYNALELVLATAVLGFAVHLIRAWWLPPAAHRLPADGAFDSVWVAEREPVTHRIRPCPTHVRRVHFFWDDRRPQPPVRRTGWVCPDCGRILSVQEHHQ